MGSASPMPHSLVARLTRPGLFITGTDTAVGKTHIACAIAALLARQCRVAVAKPFATGCRRDAAGRLIHDDAEALADAVGRPHPMDLVAPVRFEAPLAPAVAAELAGTPIDWPGLAAALARLDADADAIVVEGVGGAMVPLDPALPGATVRDLVAALGLPAVVVARAGLGTLNHTVMTVHVLRQVGCLVAGLVINEHGVDQADPSLAHNHRWLERLTGVAVLASLPTCADPRPHLAAVDWQAVMAG